LENNNFFNFFYRLPQNLAKVFWGKNLFWHALAIVLTFISVTSGFDWLYYKATQIPDLRPILFPAVFAGIILPVIVPLALFFYAKTAKNLKLLNTAFALGQAAMLSWFVSAFYKFFTGRPGPNYFGTTGSDITHIFRFGFGRGGVFWGWPSSHTTVAFAMGICLFTLFPKNKFIRALSLIYAIYIGVSVSMTIHWFSDFEAGIIFGSLVGFTVGKSFLERSKSIKNS